MPTCKDVLLFFARCRLAAYDDAAYYVVLVAAR